MTEPVDTVEPRASERDLFPIERASAGDFPFYAGQPRGLSAGGWALVVCGVLLGFLALTAHIDFYRTTIGGFVSAILFFAIPLGALALAAGGDWKAIFRKLALRDVGLMFAVAIANIVVSVAMALLIRSMFDMNANPVGAMLGESSGAQRVLFYLRTLPQLLGEEVVSVLPFLALLWFCHAKLGAGRKGAVVMAWLGAAVFFGAIHLPTYGWNFVQCFLVIGTARIVLLLGYIITKNIWVSAGAHIINDWVLFTVMVVLLDRAAGA